MPCSISIHNTRSGNLFLIWLVTFRGLYDTLLIFSEIKTRKNNVLWTLAYETGEGSHFFWKFQKVWSFKCWCRKKNCNTSCLQVCGESKMWGIVAMWSVCRYDRILKTWVENLMGNYYEYVNLFYMHIPGKFYYNYVNNKTYEDSSLFFRENYKPLARGIYHFWKITNDKDLPRPSTCFKIQTRKKEEKIIKWRKFIKMTVIQFTNRSKQNWWVFNVVPCPQFFPKSTPPHKHFREHPWA